MVYDCADGRQCTIGFDHAKPCYLYECPNPCLWDLVSCPKYDIQSESEECPLAFCSKPGPTPPPPPPPPPEPDSSLVLVDTIIICLVAGTLLGNHNFFLRTCTLFFHNMSILGMFVCLGFYYCVRRQNMEERIPLLRLWDNRNRARPASPIPLHPMHRPGSDPTPESIASSPRSEVDREDGAGRDEAEASFFRGATSIEV